MSPCILSTCSYLYTIPPPPPSSLQALPHLLLLSHLVTPIYAHEHTQSSGATSSLANKMKALVSEQIPEYIETAVKSSCQHQFKMRTVNELDLTLLVILIFYRHYATILS